jgi:hypothetical protein
MQKTLELLDQMQDGEAVYRLLVGLGTVLYGSDIVSVAAEFGVKDGMKRIKSVNAFPAKVVQCSEKILAML